MFVKAIRIAQSAMFPIFCEEKLPSQQLRLSVAGTGFFINSSGYFLTTAHLFDSANQNTRFLYDGKLPEDVCNPPLEITEVCKNDDFDIYVGKVNLKTKNYFHLSNQDPEIGKSVCISGYPLPEIQATQAGINLAGVRRYFQPTFILDRRISNTKNGQGKIRKHDGFLVRDVGLFGMSGGPVFDQGGVVVGMQGSVTQPRTSSNGNRTISVENALVIRSNLLLDFLKQNKIKTNFWGNF